EGLLALSVRIGLAVVAEVFEEEMAQLVGPRGKHSPERRAYRHGQESRQLTLGGRRIEIQKPRARTKAGEEMELESYQLFSSRQPLTQAALAGRLAGLSGRRYRAGLEHIGPVEAKAVSRSTISRRFVAGTARKLHELMGRDLHNVLDHLPVAERAF